MGFVSFAFLFFFTLVFFLHWFVFSASGRRQNLFLLFVSIVFYCIADWRFILLLLISALINYKIAQLISANENERKKRIILRIGILFNLVILGYFKYFNFFYESFSDLLGLQHHIFHILIPIGISFFTFQTIGYILDVYNEEIEVCNDPVVFLTYIIYFPKILSGPIERAQNFFSQIEKKRTFDKNTAVDALRQILWGIFTKEVIADNCAGIVDGIYANSSTLNGSTLLIGAFFYSFQVYCDFASYSNIALGISRLLGIELTQNFSMPFYSTNISDYWKKWHISLSTWMMEYVFTPLSFKLRKLKKWGLIISIIVTFTIVGFWHGANWTFLLFGFLHGIYFVPLIIRNSFSKSNIVAEGRFFPTIKEGFQMLGLFFLVMLTMVVFRSNTVSQAFDYFKIMVSPSILKQPSNIDFYQAKVTFGFIILMCILEWVQRGRLHALKLDSIRINSSIVLSPPKTVRWIIYLALVFFILGFKGEPQDFIYLAF